MIGYAVTLVKSVNMGDHAETLRESHAVVPDETVEALVARLLQPHPYASPAATDVVELRILVKADGALDVPPIPSVPPPW